MMPTQTAPQRRAPASGVAALTVVMILFFVMALVAAYTNRNLVFEQRISANSYRVARAAESAEAGLDWTVAMLNGGRIDANCVPSSNTANSDFRRRYLVDAAQPGADEGGYTFPWSADASLLMYPACINRAGVLQCICPSLATRSPVMAVPADGTGATFRVQFELPGSVSRPGAVGLIALGCASPGTDSTSCYTQQRNDVITAADALARNQLNLGLLRALPLAPLAVLTVGGAVQVSAGTLTASNGSNNAALTVHAGGALTGPSVLAGPAGSGSDGRMDNDTSLAQLAAAPDNLWFRSLFAIDPASFAALPATRVLACAGGACTAADLTATLASYPRNPVLVQGSLDLNGGGPLGSTTDPVLLIVTGALTVSTAVNISGLVHADSINWTAPASVQGALVAVNGFAASANATLTYRQDLLDTLRLRYGSFLRVPGSWKQLAN